MPWPKKIHKSHLITKKIPADGKFPTHPPKTLLMVHVLFEDKFFFNRFGQLEQ